MIILPQFTNIGVFQLSEYNAKACGIEGFELIAYRVDAVNVNLKGSRYKTPGELFCTNSLRSAVRWAETLVISDSYVSLFWALQMLDIPDDAPVTVWGDSWFEDELGDMTAGDIEAASRKHYGDMFQFRVNTSAQYPVTVIGYGYRSEYLGDKNDVVLEIESVFVPLVQMADDSRGNLEQYTTPEMVLKYPYQITDKMIAFASEQSAIINRVLEDTIALFDRSIFNENGSGIMNAMATDLVKQERRMLDNAKQLRILRPELKHLGVEYTDSDLIDTQHTIERRLQLYVWGVYGSYDSAVYTIIKRYYRELINALLGTDF